MVALKIESRSLDINNFYVLRMVVLIPQNLLTENSLRVAAGHGIPRIYNSAPCPWHPNKTPRRFPHHLQPFSLPPVPIVIIIIPIIRVLNTFTLYRYPDRSATVHFSPCSIFGTQYHAPDRLIPLNLPHSICVSRPLPPWRSSSPVLSRSPAPVPTLSTSQVVDMPSPQVNPRRSPGSRPHPAQSP